MMTFVVIYPTHKTVVRSDTRPKTSDERPATCKPSDIWLRSLALQFRHAW